MAREYRDSGIEWIGQIPKEWECTCFKRFHNDANVGESIDKYFCSDNENDTLFYTAGLKPIHTTYKDFPTWKYTSNNDLLLARNGTPYVYLPLPESIYSDHIIRVGIKVKYIREYARYCIQQAISFVVVDAVSIATWSISLWDKQFLPIPSLHEQQKIADYLDKVCGEIDEMVALQETMIEELKAYKQSVITEAVTKGLNPNVPMRNSGIDWIGEIPEHWDFARVGLFYFVTKLAGFEYTDTLMNKISSSDVVPIVRAQNVRMFRFEKESISEYIDLDTSLQLDRCSLNKKSLLMTFIGAGIGDVCIFNEPKRYHLAPNVAKIEKNSDYDDIICDEYIMYYLGSDAGKGEINKISKASAQASLSMSTIRRIAVVIPPMSEQQQIVCYLDAKCNEIDSLVALKQAKIDELKEYKKSVIYEYVTGKKEVV